MKQPPNTQKIRTGSIARRINRAQAWRRFGKSFFLTCFTTVLIAVSWCLLIEWAYGGHISNVVSRGFGGTLDWQENLYNVWNQNGIGTELKKYIREHDPFDFRPSTPFDGIEYQFTLTFSDVDGGYFDSVPMTDAAEIPLYPEVEPIQSETEFDRTMPGTEPVVTEPMDGGEAFDWEETMIHETEMLAGGVAVEVPVEVDAPVAIDISTGDGREELSTDGNLYGYYTDSTGNPVLQRRLFITHNAAGMLTVCSLIMVVSLIFQLGVLLSSLMGGSRIIKKYLKPIDEIALMADRLSTEVRSQSTAQISAQVNAQAGQGKRRGSGDMDAGQLDSLKNAINAIEDSDTKVQVHDAELGSLEAALNNMLKRLDEGKRKQIRFVDDASHELRTPIAVIQGYIQLLDRWGKEDPKVRDEAIEAIKTEADHMKTLIDQLLFLARGEMDRHVLDKVPLNVSEVLEEIRDESVMLEENSAIHHEFSLSLPMKESAEEDEFPYRDLMVRADPAMMKQAIRILRDNAVKYTPDGGRVVFKAYERTVVASSGSGRQSICIEISDTGIGIRPKELPHIFDRFYRGENVRANNSSGSGLGLSIAKWIIDEHGGIMEAISSEGFGTKMTIVLDGESGDTVNF